MNVLFTLGFLSGAVQLLGYFYYIKKTKREDISPNPTTWLIFAFDTALLVALEAVAGATLSILFLPLACAGGAIYVAWLVRKNGSLQWPTDTVDVYILKFGILIAATYTILFALWHFQIVSGELLHLAGFSFLILSNLNTFVAFTPILREVHASPLQEHAGPWTIWTIAYGLLTVLTYLEVGNNKEEYIFYLYPVSCLFLHASIAFLARDSRKIHFKET